MSRIVSWSAVVLGLFVNWLNAAEPLQAGAATSNITPPLDGNHWRVRAVPVQACPR